jgi:hypothetical protein
MSPRQWHELEGEGFGCRGAIIAAGIVLAVFALIIGFWWSIA